MAATDVQAARRAYVDAIARGAKPYIAFDLAKAAYRARHPDLPDHHLSAAVSRVLAVELQNVATVID